jgi:hypothetical protein
MFEVLVTDSGCNDWDPELHIPKVEKKAEETIEDKNVNA